MNARNKFNESIVSVCNNTRASRVTPRFNNFRRTESKEYSVLEIINSAIGSAYSESPSHRNNNHSVENKKKKKDYTKPDQQRVKNV